MATPGQRQTWRLAASSTALGLTLTVLAVAVAGPWDSGQRTAERERAAAGVRQSDGEHGGGEHSGGRQGGPPALPGPPGSAPRVVAVLPAIGARPGTEAPMPAAAALADTLNPLLDDPALGTVRTASVVDATTGRQLFAADEDRTTIPASTIKLATAVAALSALGPDHRIVTRVLADEAADEPRVVLVGGGDPTLTEDQLEKLADRTARALQQRGTTEVSVAFDAHRYSGPAQHPIGANDNIAPVSALMVNAGRTDDSTYGPAPRTPDPAGDAADSFAALLRGRGIDIRGSVSPAGAAARGDTLATSRSAPLAALVERMLTYSDNDLGEALARQVAIATGGEASFTGAGQAVRGELARLDLPLSGTVFKDGSGLMRDDRVSAALLSQLLVRSADPDHPELRPVLTGLPVAGFSGTLSGRYGGDGTSDRASEQEAAGAGLVRAKTGTLSGVNSLAGTVVDADGRLLAFAFLVNGVPDRDKAQTALDRLASAVANCGCR